MSDQPIEIRDFRKAKFFWLDNIVVDEYVPKIGGMAFATYAYLCRYVFDERQTCWPGQRRMAKALGVSLGSINKCLKILENHGMIRTERGNRRESSKYQILDIALGKPSVHQDEHSSRSECSSECSPGVTEQDQVDKHLVISVDPKSSDLSPEKDFSLTGDIEQSKKAPKKVKKSSAQDERWGEFKTKLEKFWKYLNSSDLYWTPADSKQLLNFLMQFKDVNLQKFHQTLLNYMESENIVASKTPKQFLPHLNLYFDSPLDKYGKPLRDSERTVH